jgi:hypothetical protein
VQVDTGLVGWAAEGDANGYWLTLLNDVDRSGQILYLFRNQLLKINLDGSGGVLIYSPPTEGFPVGDDLMLARQGAIEQAQWSPTGRFVAFVLGKPILENAEELLTPTLDWEATPTGVWEDTPTPAAAEWGERNTIIVANWDGQTLSNFREAYAADTAEKRILRYAWNEDGDGLIIEVANPEGELYYFLAPIDGSEVVRVGEDDVVLATTDTRNPAHTHKYETCPPEPEDNARALYVCVTRLSGGDTVRVADLPETKRDYTALWLDDKHLLLWVRSMTGQFALYVALSDGNGVRRVAWVNGGPDSPPQMLPGDQRLLLNYGGGIYLASVSDLIQYISNAVWVTNGYSPFYKK